jgi:hypothetical protein
MIVEIKQETFLYEKMEKNVRNQHAGRICQDCAMKAMMEQNSKQERQKV